MIHLSESRVALRPKWDRRVDSLVILHDRLDDSRAIRAYFQRSDVFPGLRIKIASSREALDEILAEVPEESKVDLPHWGMLVFLTGSFEDQYTQTTPFTLQEAEVWDYPRRVCSLPFEWGDQPAVATQKVRGVCTSAVRRQLSDALNDRSLPRSRAISGRSRLSLEEYFFVHQEFDHVEQRAFFAALSGKAKGLSCSRALKAIEAYREIAFTEDGRYRGRAGSDEDHRRYKATLFPGTDIPMRKVKMAYILALETLLYRVGLLRHNERSLLAFFQGPSPSMIKKT